MLYIPTTFGINLFITVSYYLISAVSATHYTFPFLFLTSVSIFFALSHQPFWKFVNLVISKNKLFVLIIILFSILLYICLLLH